MPRTRKAKSLEDQLPVSPSPPAQTLESRENQLILLATNLAEKQLRDGTASAQVISHYLKLGSTRERLEQEKLRHDNELSRAKKENLESQRQQEIELQEVMKAFKSYAGQDDEDDDYLD